MFREFPRKLALKSQWLQFNPEKVFHLNFHTYVFTCFQVEVLKINTIYFERIVFNILIFDIFLLFKKVRLFILILHLFISNIPVNLEDNDLEVLTCVEYFEHPGSQNLIPYQTRPRQAETINLNKKKEWLLIQYLFAKRK